MNTNMKSLYDEARSVQERLLNSDSHNTTAAVPPVAEEAVAVISKLMAASNYGLSDAVI